MKFQLVGSFFWLTFLDLTKVSYSPYDSSNETLEGENSERNGYSIYTKNVFTIFKDVGVYGWFADILFFMDMYKVWDFDIIAYIKQGSLD